MLYKNCYQHNGIRLPITVCRNVLISCCHQCRICVIDYLRLIIFLNVIAPRLQACNVLFYVYMPMLLCDCRSFIKESYLLTFLMTMLISLLCTQCTCTCMCVYCTACASNTFQCVSNGMCIPTCQLCDGYSQCGDDSDESDCTRINSKSQL